jgi:hypothetical protein
MKSKEIVSKDWWSWVSIISYTDRLGIPNFQRGAVWDSGNRMALLESIYEQSPCGSFVFWQPDIPGIHGVPLKKFSGEGEPLWIVDGQQRMRTMLDTFRQLLEPHANHSSLRLVRQEDIAALWVLGEEYFADITETTRPEESDQDEESDTEHPLWFVVLPAMTVFDRDKKPLFGELSESKSVRRGSMFRRLYPRTRLRLNEKGKVRPVPPIPLGCIPFAALISPASLFCNSGLRKAAKHALASFDTSTPDHETLQDLLPWGPQFVTGHAFQESGVPMTWLHLAQRHGEDKVKKQVKSLMRLLGRPWQGVFQSFKQMLNGDRFAVDSLPRSNVSAAIDAYVRINRAGIRVRPEEQALALLSRARPDLLNDLEYFTVNRDKVPNINDQRALLAHESDRQMGFSVWMATVTRYTCLSLLGDSARKWLWTSAIDKETFAYRLDRVSPDETDTGKATWCRTFSSSDELIDNATQRATAALLLLDDVISNELSLDHRMARSQAASLQPVIDMFYRIPYHEIGKLQKDTPFRSALARVLLYTLLCPYIDKTDMQSLIISIHGINEEDAQKKASPMYIWGSEYGEEDGVCTNIKAALQRYLHKLEEIWKRRYGTPPENTLPEHAPSLARLALHAFKLGLDEARSLQHRTVGWLYAIERRNKAREFSWAAQFTKNEIDPSIGIQKTIKNESFKEMPLKRPDDLNIAEQLYPEKQHIIPFVVAKRIIGKGGSRATTSPVNAIGNLTWISRRQNSLEGLADRWTAMDIEIDQENLNARGILVNINGSEKTVLEVYNELIMILKNECKNKIDKAKYIYEVFCDSRKQWMKEQMKSWLLEEIPHESQKWLKNI